MKSACQEGTCMYETIVRDISLIFNEFRVAPLLFRILFTVGNVDQDIGRHSGRHSVETRSIVVPDVSWPI